MFDLLGNVLTLIGAIGVASAALILLLQSTSSFKLLRRMNAKIARGSIWGVTRTLVSIARRQPRSLVSSENSFFRWVRIRVEHEIFDPRPEFRWPLPDDDELYGSPGYRVDIKEDMTPAEQRRHRRAVRKQVKAAWRRRRDLWRTRMDALFSVDAQKIEVGTAGELNDSLGDIKRYFDTLRTLKIAVEKDVKFLCAVTVKTGYIAPLHLLAGLLVRYNEKWGDILAGFEEDTRDVSGLKSLGPFARDFRQIQSFIYHCWLLWGPSIPLCDDKCGWWGSDDMIVQYGFGDENNSIEVVGKRSEILDDLKELLKNDDDFAGMAWPAKVTGLLQYSSIADMEKVPPALEASWKGKQDERPILFISRHSGYDAQAGAMQSNSFEGGIFREKEKREQGLARYYSAYLWIMFVVLRKVNDDWVVLHAPEAEPKDGGFAASLEPWKASIPFFEHANLADAESCAFGKRQLAAKTLNGLAELVAQIPDAGENLRFAYAAAVDDPNCGRKLALGKLLSGGTTIAALMQKRLAEVQPGNAADPLSRLLAGSKKASLIDFEHFTSQSGHHPHSGCAMPSHVGAHYEWLDKAIPAE